MKTKETEVERLYKQTLKENNKLKRMYQQHVLTIKQLQKQNRELQRDKTQLTSTVDKLKKQIQEN